MSVQFKPEGYSTVTPYLVVEDAGRQIEFLQQAFGAKEIERTTTPDGRIRHAEMRVYDCVIMLGQSSAEMNALPCAHYVYVADTDGVYRAALAAGATSMMEPSDHFYGDRNAGVRDPLGNLWWIATHIEDVSPDEIARRAAQGAK